MHALDEDKRTAIEALERFGQNMVNGAKVLNFEKALTH